MHEIYINLVEFLHFHEKAGPGAPMAQTLYKPNEIQCFWESFYPQNALWGKKLTLGWKCALSLEIGDLAQKGAFLRKS